MKDGNGKRTFELGPIDTMGFKHQKQNPPNPLKQDTSIPHIPCEKTPQQLTPGPSAMQWSEDLFCNKQQAITFLILTFDSSGLTLPPFVEPSQHNEPPIPGPIQCSEPQVPSHEDALTHEPEPEEAPTQSTEEPFLLFSTFPHPSVIIIDNTPIGSPPASTPSPEIPPIASMNPTASSSQSHNEAQKEFTDLFPTLMIPQAIVHESINRILLEHGQLLHMITFVDSTD
ncbi:hypothetical protein O181_029306 [Austropuccinia psidii MF-1]|uniref:Uncharacterized protein n=1 Tax=Austropuccinia psidii MF-1 TaxID=1389203 RepID=A0A9Q3CW75_9BASI|nr:hypothetical protein [Austropuccinia psidii MF-1]